MQKLFLTILSVLLSSSCFAQGEIWSKVTDWNPYIEQGSLSRIVAYALYDIDGDGINEAFVRDKNDDYACLTCGGGKVQLAVSTIMTTHLTFCKGMPYVVHSGGCGTSCWQEEYCRIENSTPASLLQHVGIGEEEHDCSIFQKGDSKDITYAQFQKMTPKLGELSEMESLKWIPVSSSIPEATLETISGDTIIYKDAKGYFYQVTGDHTVGVAPGGAYAGDIVIPSSIDNTDGTTFQVTSVRRGAFWKKADAANIGSITSITLPETVTLIGADAFRGNAALASVKYGANTRIEVRSFWGCPKLRVQKNEPQYAFTETYDSDPENEPYDKDKFYSTFTRMYFPSDQENPSVMHYNWAFFKSNHSGVAFDSWKNMNNDDAMECYCANLERVKAGLFRMLNPDNVASMFRGYLESDRQMVVLADNDYVATHEFPAFSRWRWGEDEKSMPQTFIASMEQKYGRPVNYSYECGKVTRSGEQLAITEFKITNREAMIVLTWLKDGKEVCSYARKQKLDPGMEEDMSVWNVDDDGTYGIPFVLTIARDEQGHIELFLYHGAPESSNFQHLVQQGNKLVEAFDTSWYNLVD